MAAKLGLSCTPTESKVISGGRYNVAATPWPIKAQPLEVGLSAASRAIRSPPLPKHC